MKFYPTFIINRQEIENNSLPLPLFMNGMLDDINIIPVYEDYCQRPLISIQQSTRNPDEYFLFAADGYVQYNPLTQRRSVVLIGTLENLKIILADMIKEQHGRTPRQVFDSYMYPNINIEMDLREWIDTL